GITSKKHLADGARVHNRPSCRLYLMTRVRLRRATDGTRLPTARIYRICVRFLKATPSVFPYLSIQTPNWLKRLPKPVRTGWSCIPKLMPKDIQKIGNQQSRHTALRLPRPSRQG